MKKDKKEDKARVRVFFGEIEGDNETIRDGLRSIAEAVNKTFQQETRVIKVIATGTAPDQRQLTTELEQQITDIALGNEEGEEYSSEPELEKQKSKSHRPKKAPAYSFVKDLNLRPEGKQSLRQFFEEKKPSEQYQQVTGVIYYLHHVLEVENISVNHVYTAEGSQINKLRA